MPDRITVDFNIHDVVRLRLINPSSRDIATVSRQLGHVPTNSLNKEPDITVRFSENLSPSSFKLLGLNEIGFTENGLYILNKFSGKPKAQISFETCGECFEIVCKRGIDSVPLLIDILKLAFLQKNFVPLHASAFVYNGTGVLVTGWVKGGKTSALLAFADRGAWFVGDDWVFVSSDGEKMVGLQSHLEISEWQLNYAPKLRSRVDLLKRITFFSIRALEHILGLVRKSPFGSSQPGKTIGKVVLKLKDKRKFSVHPEALFQDRIQGQAVRPDKIILSISHSEPDVILQFSDPAETLQRIAHANAFEYMQFYRYYKAFKFAFPHIHNEFLENMDQLQRQITLEALRDKDIYQVLHPYPAPIDALYKQLVAIFESGT